MLIQEFVIERVYHASWYRFLSREFFFFLFYFKGIIALNFISILFVRDDWEPIWIFISMLKNQPKW